MTSDIVPLSRSTYGSTIHDEPIYITRAGLVSGQGFNATLTEDQQRWTLISTSEALFHICDKRTRDTRSLIKSWRIVDLQHITMLGSILDPELKKAVLVPVMRLYVCTLVSAGHWYLYLRLCVPLDCCLRVLSWPCHIDNASYTNAALGA